MTVGDLIEKLRAFDPASPVEMVDADTGWRITEIHVTEGHHEIPDGEATPGTVYLWCPYGDMPALK